MMVFMLFVGCLDFATGDSGRWAQCIMLMVCRASLCGPAGADGTSHSYGSMDTAALPDPSPMLSVSLWGRCACGVGKQFS